MGTKLRDFASHVKELRERRTFSQSELAVAAKMSPATLSRVLSGERPLRMDQAVALAQALGVTVIELTAGTTAQEVVAEWVPRHEYEVADRLRAEAERALGLAQGEVSAARAENASLRDGIRSLASRVTNLEAELGRAAADALRVPTLSKKAEELEREVLHLRAELARERSLASQLQQQAAGMADAVDQNYQAWASAKNQVQTLEQSLAAAHSEKVGVAFVSAALGGLAAAILATPAKPGRRRT